MIVFDGEMSGNDERVHSLVSLGAIDFDHPEQQFYGECQIWPESEISLVDLAKNGFTPEQIRDPMKMRPGQLVAKFIFWALKRSERTLAGHNPRMDYAFCIRACERERIIWPFGYRIIDLHSICWAHMAERGLLPQPVNGLSDVGSDVVSVYAGLPPEPKPHHGLNGAKWEAESLSRLVHRRNLLPEFAQYPLPDYLMS